MAIWRENETLTYVTPRGNYDDPVLEESQRSLYIMFTDLRIDIVGKTDKAIGETAAYFIGLEKQGDEDTSTFLQGSDDDSPLDLNAAGSLCWTHMFDVGPSRDVAFTSVTL